MLLEIKNLNLKQILLYSIFLFLIFLPFSVGPRYIFMGTTIFLGFYYIYKNNIKIKLDIINISLIIFVIISFLSNYFNNDTILHNFKINKDILRDLLVFLVIRHIDLNSNEIKKYITTPLFISFIVVFFIGFIETYFLDLSKDGRFRMMGPVNRSVVYMLYILSLSIFITFTYKIKDKFYALTNFTFILSVFGILVGASRSGWVVLIALFGFTFFYFKLNKAILVKSIILLIVLAIFAYVFVPDLFLAKLNFKVPYRFDIWLAGITQYWNSGNIFFGIGSNNYIQIDLTSYTENWIPHVSEAHNSFISIVVENGILGILSFLIFLISITYAISFSKKKLLGFLTIITFTLSSLSHSILMREFGMIFFVLLALSINRNLKEQHNESIICRQTK